MSTRVFITGMGLISAAGNNVSQNRDHLEQGETGIRKGQLLDSRYVDIFPLGEIPFSTCDLQKKAGIADEKGISRTEILAQLAFQEALNDSGL